MTILAQPHTELQTSSSDANWHREVLLLHIGATVFFDLSGLRGLRTLCHLQFAFVNFLNSDRAEQFRRCFPRYPRTCILGCCYMRRAVHEQHCDNRCCSCALQAPTLPWQSVNGISSTNDEYATPQNLRLQPLRFKAVLHQERSAAKSMACGAPFSDYLSFVIIHLGMSYKTLPDPMVRLSQ